MTPRPHDALFKLAFEAPACAAALLAELLPPMFRDAVAWETVLREPAAYVEPALDERFGDLLFSVRLRTGAAPSLFVLLEHQSTEDRAMPLRTLSYQTRLWNRLRRERPARPGKPDEPMRDTREPMGEDGEPRGPHELSRERWLAPVITVVVNHVPGGWSSPRTLEDMFDPMLRTIPLLAALLPRYSLHVEDLARRTDDDLRASSLGAFQQLALWLLRDSRNPTALLHSFEAWAPTMLRAARDPAGTEMLRAVFTYLFRVIPTKHLDDLRAKIRWLGRRAKDTAMTIDSTAATIDSSEMTIADYLHEEGRKEGLAAMLRNLLLVKFEQQALDERHEARLRTATPELLDRILRRALAADTLDVGGGGAAPPPGSAAGRSAPTVDDA